ncbi:hypothetical protein AB0I95_15005 [Micromonospora sp. NPDC049751]|uniref:hypothetical protein n=1 Tax=Micromonospora sp. NPDC049751 TaxID=3154837 RepID=UPI0033C2727C
MNDPYRRFWAACWRVWLALVAVSFAILEGIALYRRKPGDTLSENTRTWLRTDKGWRSAGPLAFIGVLVAFVVWFVPHIVWETW